jgi:predicted AAA+ superfamily ATPase
VRSWLGEADLYVNLLPEQAYLGYMREPGRFRQEVLLHLRRHGNGGVVVVDEIQKVPSLLDEVHDLIETYDARFILTGSSARKLKRGAANLLAGRALTHRLFPLTYEELGSDFDLERALRLGTLPYLWETSERQALAADFLRSYADTYLREEVQAEGLVRDLGPFVRFLDVAALNDGQVASYSTVARDCGVSVKTVQGYYEILEDTFLAYRLPAWTRSERKRLVSHPRYYLLDPGVTNALTQSLGRSLNAEVRGRRFEQWVVTTLWALIAYRKLELGLHFWRTHDGAEVDLLVTRGQEVLAALEIKNGARLLRRDLRGLRRFAEDYPNVPRWVIVPRGPARVREGDVIVTTLPDFVNENLPGWA